MKARMIEIEGLTKRYGGSKTNAIDNLNLTIHAGEVYGFLGSNGAGKSTTIRTLLNFIQPTAGRAAIMGFDVVKEAVEVHKSIGYLAGDVALPKNVTGRQLLGYLGKLHGKIDRRYLDSLAHRFEAQLDKKLGTLSKGNRQKIGLLQAFMHQPQVLVLDEPTSGLDPLMQEQFYKMILEAKERGAAVFLSSHNFSEVERVCDRVAIIREGKLVADVSVEELRKDNLPTWRITVKSKIALKQLAGSKALTVTQSDGVSATVKPAASISAALAALANVEIVAMDQTTDDLEDEFMSFYSGGETS
jgi:ABC-2 type transport system ATP-binding protein